jgi:hypothetical protein
MDQGSSKSLLPLVEILIAIGIFAIAVVLTLQLFLLASFLGHKTADTARAIFEVQTVAENIKSMKTDAEIENYIKTDLGGDVSDKAKYILYYDEEWHIMNGANDATYMLKVDMSKVTYSSGGLYNFALDLYKIKAYPFIDDKKLEKDETYIPLLVSINASKFIVK